LRPRRCAISFSMEDWVDVRPLRRCFCIASTRLLGSARASRHGVTILDAIDPPLIGQFRNKVEPQLLADYTVSCFALGLDGAAWGRLRVAGLAIFRAIERVAAFGLELRLLMGSSEVGATLSVAPPQPYPGKYPAGQDPKAPVGAPIVTPQQRSNQFGKPVLSEQDCCSPAARSRTHIRSTVRYPIDYGFVNRRSGVQSSQPAPTKSTAYRRNLTVDGGAFRAGNRPGKASARFPGLTWRASGRWRRGAGPRRPKTRRDATQGGYCLEWVAFRATAQVRRTPD